MKKTKVNIPWEAGLCVLPAARLAQLAAMFGSRITLRFGRKVADASSIMSLLMLCAHLGAPIEVVALGNDEGEAIAAVESFFDETNIAADWKM